MADYTLDHLLSLFRIDVQLRFNPESPWGYYNTIEADVIETRCRELGLATNRLGDHEVIATSEPVWLGKETLKLVFGTYVTTLHSRQEWQNLRSAYEDLRALPAVPEMSFPEECVVVVPEYVGYRTLHDAGSGDREKFLDFLRGLNRLGYAHRDLHAKNVIVSGDDLKVVDWDFVTRQSCPLAGCYDVTGQGLPSPHRTNRCHVFKSFPALRVKSVAELLNFSSSDL